MIPRCVKFKGIFKVSLLKIKIPGIFPTLTRMNKIQNFSDFSVAVENCLTTGKIDQKHMDFQHGMVITWGLPSWILHRDRTLAIFMVKYWQIIMFDIFIKFVITVELSKDMIWHVQSIVSNVDVPQLPLLLSSSCQPHLRLQAHDDGKRPISGSPVASHGGQKGCTSLCLVDVPDPLAISSVPSRGRHETHNMAFCLLNYLLPHPIINISLENWSMKIWWTLCLKMDVPKWFCPKNCPHPLPMVLIENFVLVKSFLHFDHSLDFMIYALWLCIKIYH